ncbi:MAG: 50S ribosomal protein L10 [Chloroflexota bacterium]|nr:50S ribosomal protein L10 [Chloroflexota bacterium]
MAFTRKEKEAIVKQYSDWIENSNGFFIMGYRNMDMAAVDQVRSDLREVDGEIHVVKNRLFKLVMDEMKLDFEEEFWEENNLVGFAFSDAPSVAKVMSEISKTATFKIRLGYVDQNLISAANVKALASLPTLPVMRGIMLGTILASASKLVRTLAEPARSMAAVVKAFSDEGQVVESAA